MEESNCNINMDYTNNKSNESFSEYLAHSVPALKDHHNVLTTQSASKLNICDNVKLQYTVHRYSSFSTTYFPENILTDRPHDQGSRWSAFSNNPPQYIILRLRRPAIVRYIKFGKFEKSHVCNLKKFRIFGGLSEESMILLAEGGLKNDHLPETVTLKHTADNSGNEFPILYLKIVPLLSWGPTFNFCIWYVELTGQDDPMLTADTMVDYNARRESEIIRLCLKHFRQQGYTEAFNALQRQTNVELEHPMITELHELLVLAADYDRTESFLEQCISQGLMDKYLQEQDYRHRWIMQHVRGNLQPGNRGGHQLVMDAKKRLIYLYGGWDGFQDLGDFWVFDLEKHEWTLLYEQTELHGGPTPRSCHRMVFDPISENIFMLGRYLDNSIRTRDYIRSDFYLYDTRQGCWMLISEDTNTEGGPKLVHDHQMCIDAEKRMIYVFGGKVLTPRNVTTSALSEVEYSGLYSYHIDTNTWTQILVDCHHPTAAQADILSIKSCLSHCMVFNTKNRKLYIYGGNRGKEDIQDFITYDVDTQCLEVLNKGNPMGYLINDTPNKAECYHEPPTGYTMRATIDCNREEIYVFTSLSKYKDRLLQQVNGFNSFWVYSIRRGKWSRVYTCLGNNLADGNNQAEPCPRFAHQLIYDEVANEHYLFGGNPGKMHTPELRLDDFWTLQLEKPRRKELLQHCRFSVRKLRYKEIARSNPLKAMRYLRTEVAAVVDKNNSKQLNDFHKLAALVFQPTSNECELLSGDNYDFSVSHLPYTPTSNHTEATDMEKLESENDSNQTCCSSSSGFSGSNSPTTAPSPDIWYEVPQNSAQEHKNRLQRCFLFNCLVQLMPSSMIPPEKNLSDFVVP